MAISTIATFFGILVFVTVHSQLGVVVSSMGVSLAVTTMYAVIYGYTPEVFEPRVRSVSIPPPALSASFLSKGTDSGATAVQHAV